MQGCKTINCPTCNEECCLPEKGVEGLAHDFNLEFMSQAWALIATSKNPEKVKCMDCRKQSKEMKFCSDCRDYLCWRCAEHHENLWRTETHKLVKASEVDHSVFKTLKSPELTYCKDPAHSMYALDFYCESCDVLLCQYCLLADHRDKKAHKTQKLARVASQHKQTMQSLLTPADDALQQLQHTVQESHQTEENTSVVEKKLKEEIEEKFNALEQELKTRREELLKEVSSIATQKRQCLSLHRESFVIFQENIQRLVRKINKASCGYRDHEILSLQGLLQTQLDKQLQVFLQFPLHINESSVIPHALDMANITTAVRNLAQVSCGSSAEHSTVSLQIKRAIKGRERKIFVTTLDETDKVFELGREDIKIKFEHPETGSVVKAIAGYQSEYKRYSASFVPQHLGEHKLTVTIRNRLVQGSPFSIWVREPRDWTQLPYASLETYLSSSVMGNSYVYGLALLSHRRLLVTQCDYIRVIDLETSNTKKIGEPGNGDSQLNSPSGTAIHGDHIYVADSDNHRIHKLHAEDNTFQSKFGEKGNGDNQLNYPRGICIDLSGSVYVSDQNNHRIAIFDSDGGFRKITHPQIKSPWGIAFDHSGNLHVVSYDSSIHAVNIFSPGGEHLGQYGNGNLTSPSAIAIDEEGYSFVVEYNGTSSRLQIFNPAHTLIKTITGFSYSEGVVIANDGSILVGDRNNYRILKC